MNLAEKKALEHAALREFQTAYNVNRAESERITIKPSDGIPDGSGQLPGRTIGIEVAHVYGTDVDARNRLGRTPDIRTMRRGSRPWDEQVRNAMIPVPVRVLSELSEILECKAKKRYGGTTWLMVRSGIPDWSVDDFENLRPEIVVRPQHGFDAIWLLCGRTAESGLMRLA